MVSHDLNNSSFNASFVELDRMNDLNGSLSSAEENQSTLNTELIVNLNESTGDKKLASTSSAVLDSSLNGEQAPKNNSFLLKVKSKHASTPLTSSATSTLQSKLSVESPEQLFEIIKSPKSNKMQENSRLKHTIRANDWSTGHSIRRTLWKSLLQLSDQQKATVNDKENNNSNNCNSLKLIHSFNLDETEYNRNLNHVFGKCNHFVHWNFDQF